MPQLGLKASINCPPYIIPVDNGGGGGGNGGASPSVVAQSPFPGGGNSYSFDGSTQRMDIANNGDFNFGTNDFTIEWFENRQDNNAYPRPFTLGRYPAAQLGMSYEGYLYLWVSGANPVAPEPPRYSWQHLAVVRQSGVMSFYINGVLNVGGINKPDPIGDSSTGLQIAYDDPNNSNTFFGGWMTNFRLTNGVAVYTGNFDVPTSTLQNTQSSSTNISAIPSGAVKVLLVP